MAELPTGHMVQKEVRLTKSHTFSVHTFCLLRGPETANCIDAHGAAEPKLKSINQACELPPIDQFEAQIQKPRIPFNEAKPAGQ